MNIQQLSTSENVLLSEQLWESGRPQASNSHLTLVQPQELDTKLAAFEIDQGVGDSWKAVKNRITSR